MRSHCIALDWRKSIVGSLRCGWVRLKLGAALTPATRFDLACPHSLRGLSVRDCLTVIRWRARARLMKVHHETGFYPGPNLGRCWVRWVTMHSVMSCDCSC